MKSRVFRSILTSVLMLVVISSVFAETEYKGVVTELVKDNLTTYMKFGIDGFKGEVTWIIGPGAFVKGPIYNEKGETIQEGDLLATTDKGFYKYDVLAYEGDLKAAEGDLKLAKLNYNRSVSLEKTNAVSKKERDEDEATLVMAEGTLMKTKADLESSKFILDHCELRAPFDGYVQEILTRPGSWSNIDYPALILRRLYPLYVDVKMDREDARAIVNGEKGVTIYPDTSGEPVGAFSNRIQYNDDGIRIPVDNYLLDKVNTNSDVPVVTKLVTITRFYRGLKDSSSALCIPTTSVYKDDKGDYVWYAEGQRLMQPGKVLDKKFKVVKKYIVLGDKLRESITGKVQLIKDIGDLEEYDIIIGSDPAKLKDGIEVEYKRIKTLFWPGDEVKVIIK